MTNNDRNKRMIGFVEFKQGTNGKYPVITGHWPFFSKTINECVLAVKNGPHRKYQSTHVPTL